MRPEEVVMVSGSCLCGAVRYRVDGRISELVLCHCTKCRKANGSAFHAGAVCRKSRFRWEAGEDAVTEYRTDSGYTTRFCATCGSPVPCPLDDRPYVVLHGGALDQDPGSRPRCHIFVASRAPWFEITDALERYDAHGPDT
jgi:hypothetical protein